MTTNYYPVCQNCGHRHAPSTAGCPAPEYVYYMPKGESNTPITGLTNGLLAQVETLRAQLHAANEDAACWKVVTTELMKSRRHFGILYDDTMPPEHRWRVTVYGKQRKYFDGATANAALVAAGLIPSEQVTK